MKNYLKMIRYMRPAGSVSEKAFIDRFIRPLGVQEDEAGNLIKRIGTAPVLWSSHTDTVHRQDGLQKVTYKDGFIQLADGEKSNCLGADCTTGVWIMCEMIKRGVEGLYIFHRGEECGGIGSSHIAQKTPELLDGIQFAIAFDRYATTSIITHQFGECASAEFADSLRQQIPYLKPDSGGIFTDTANYTEIIPECTNLSVGYYHHHTSNEKQDVAHMVWLMKQMCKLDISKLVAKRDPSVVSYSRFGRGSYYGADFGYDYDFTSYGRYRAEASSTFSTPTKRSNREALLELVLQNPEAIADLLDQYSLTADDIEQFIYT